MCVYTHTHSSSGHKSSASYCLLSSLSHRSTYGKCCLHSLTVLAHLYSLLSLAHSTLAPPPPLARSCPGSRRPPLPYLGQDCNRLPFPLFPGFPRHCTLLAFLLPPCLLFSLAGPSSAHFRAGSVLSILYYGPLFALHSFRGNLPTSTGAAVTTPTATPPRLYSHIRSPSCTSDSHTTACCTHSYTTLRQFTLHVRKLAHQLPLLLDSLSR